MVMMKTYDSELNESKEVYCLNHVSNYFTRRQETVRNAEDVYPSSLKRNLLQLSA